MNLTGKITKILANFYYVQDANYKTWECFARSRLLKEGKLLFVGEVVEIECSTTTQGVIVDVKTRKNKLSKPPVANIDQVLVVFSTCEPEFDLYNLDRYLSFCRYELNNEQITILINKIDLKKININKIYKNSGFEVFYASALTKEGLDKLLANLINKTTVLTGPSGVGKSSLIKSLAPNIDIKVGSLSAIKQGKHITRNVQLISISNNGQEGFLVDTPGFTQINFSGQNPYKILKTFNELSNHGCSYNNCLHYDEEGCSIQKKIKAKLIPNSRFESYLKILEEVKSGVAYNTKEESKIKAIKGKRGKSKYIPKIDEALRGESRRKMKQELQEKARELDY